jgi:hypothetical protein
MSLSLLDRVKTTKQTTKKRDMEYAERVMSVIWHLFGYRPVHLKYALRREGKAFIQEYLKRYPGTRLRFTLKTWEQQ